MLIRVDITEKSMGAKHLFEGLIFSVEEKEKVAIIGRNGVGKTTLFNILSGDDNHYLGEINQKRSLNLVATKQEFLGLGNETAIEYICNNLPEYLELKSIIDSFSDKSEMTDVEINAYAEALDRFSHLGYYDIENAILKNLNNFGINEDQANLKFSSLSGGQKRFVDLVRVELSVADIALVDEPTNHMDYVGKEAFIKWLKNTKQAVVVITHDRDILANIEKIIEIKDKKAYIFPGNYDAYLRQNGTTTVNKISNFETGQRALNKLKKQISEARAKKLAASSDTAIKFRVLEERLQKEYDKLKSSVVKPSFWIDQETIVDMPDKVVESYEKYKAKNIKIKHQSGSKYAGNLLEIKKLSLGYGFPLFHDVSIEISSGKATEIKGRNGAGKTTLVRTILDIASGKEPKAKIFEGKIEAGAEIKIGYYEQEISESLMELTLAEAIIDIYKNKDVAINDEKTRQIMSDYLFDVLSDGKIKVKNLSGGQKARLQIIKMLCDNPNLLILDEPTNHLDLPSIEELEKSLALYEGAVIYVSHDSYFSRNLGGEVIKIGE